MMDTDKIGILPEDNYNGGYKELSLPEINQEINELDFIKICESD